MIRENKNKSYLNKFNVSKINKSSPDIKDLDGDQQLLGNLLNKTYEELEALLRQ